MRGYYTGSAFWGWVPRFKKYIQFPTDKEYIEYLEEEMQ